MSKKPLLSESQVAKWMKLANIDQNATKNFLAEGKKNSKVLKEMYGDMPQPPAGARDDEMGDDMAPDMEEDEELDGGLDMGDGAMDDESSVVDMDEEGAEDSQVYDFDTNSELKGLVADAMQETMPQFSDAIKNAIKDVMAEIGLADEEGGVEEVPADEESEDMDMPDEEGPELEGGDEPAAEPADEESEEPLDESIEGLDVLTDDEIVNEVLKRVIRRLI